jgi:hypothetical protein
MINVHCKDSPTGRHRMDVLTIGLECVHCGWVPKRAALLSLVNSAMMLTADEAEHIAVTMGERGWRWTLTQLLRKYARQWRGE